MALLPLHFSIVLHSSKRPDHRAAPARTEQGTAPDTGLLANQRPRCVGWPSVEQIGSTPAC